MNNVKNFDSFSEEYDELQLNEKKKADKKEDKKDEKDKKDDSGKSDEDKYLTAKQKKLPDAFKASIIKKAKAKK